MRSLRRGWNRWWFGPISPGPLGLFRFVFGLLVLAYGVMLFPDRAVWFSEGGVLTAAQADYYNEFYAPVPYINLLHGATDGPYLTGFFLVFLGAALTLALGLWTRLSAVIVFVALASLHNRNNAIHNSGDTVMMVMSVYLMLAPSGAACSWDRLRRIFAGREGDAAPSIAPWAQRLMQLQVAAVYCSTSCSKLTGSHWRDGTAAYYPLHLPESARFPMPGADNMFVIHALTWGTMAVETALWTLVWVPRLRLWALAAGVGLHLGIEYSLNIPLFSFLMMASYLTFVTEGDLKNFVRWMNEPLARTRLRLVYDGECDFCRSALLVVRFFDVFRLVTLLDYHRPDELAQAPGVRFEDADEAVIALDMRGRQFAGFYAWRVLAWRLPMLWLVAPLGYVPGIPWLGRRVYAWVVKNRSRLPVAGRYKTPPPRPAPKGHPAPLPHEARERGQ